MNVMTRDLPANRQFQLKTKQIGLIRKSTAKSMLGQNSFKKFPCAISKTPRYQFGRAPAPTKSKLVPLSMGPPSVLPKSLKKRTTQSGSGCTEFSSDGPARPRVLASDSMLDTLHDVHTPANRPTALRYISSSSKGHTHPHSARSTTTSVAEPSVILAITEGRALARGEIGLAAVDLRRPHLVLCQFSDSLLYSHTLTKINYFNPVEIIVPNTFCEGAVQTQLYCLIRDQYPGVPLTPVQRRHFQQELGKQQIQSLCAPAYSGVYMQVLHKFYALTAAAAVLKYVENIQCVVFARESLKIEYHCSENTMLIDVGTATQLELVAPLEQSAGPSCCLLGVLGPTYTAGGIRALRASVLQPPNDPAIIEARLDCVQEFIDSDEGLMSSVQDVIKKLTDAEKILFLCLEPPTQDMNKMSEAQLNQTLLLKTTMDLVPKLVEALVAAQSGRLRKIKMDFENPHYKEIADRIHQVIQDDAHMEKGCLGTLQRCFAVKPDINGLLDVARRTYSELIDDLQKMVEALSEEYDLPIRLNRNTLKGFHIVMPLTRGMRKNFNEKDLPPIFIQVQNNGASVSMTTEELVVLDQQAKESLNEIHSMSNIVIYGLLKELRPFMGSLYTLCENIAELDIILALAQTSSAGCYVRPDFNQYLEIHNSVHPLLEYNSQKQPVPNDVFASTEYNFTVITGPNMGGKSIYIKQIAVLQIMAQIGCFVPATNAVLRLTDHIFSRIGFNDSVELNASTFVLEMKEIQHILKDLTPTSLIIIDELCRGTSSEEGASMAWAICEQLLQTSAFTFFTTHFMYLTRLQTLYLNVTNLHTTVDEELYPNSTERRLIYKHKIEPGVTSIEHYGLALARNTNLPKMTIKLAEELAEVIALNKKPLHQPTSQREDEVLIYKLNADIKKEMRKSDHSEATVKSLLESFRKENPALMQRLKAMNNSQTEISATSAPVSSKSSVSPRTESNNKEHSSKTSSSCENIPLHNTDKATLEILNYSILKEVAVDTVENKATDDCEVEYHKSIDSVAAIDNLTVKHTDQLLNIIPIDHNSYNTNASETAIVAVTNEDVVSIDEDFNWDEESIRAIDETESNQSMITIHDTEMSGNTNKENINTFIQILQESLSGMSLDLENEPPRILQVSSLESIVSVDKTTVARNFASQSTLVLELRSQKSMDLSSSPLSGDEVLFVETVAEIHNDLELYVPELETTETVEDLILPPPLAFAD